MWARLGYIYFILYFFIIFKYFIYIHIIILFSVSHSSGFFTFKFLFVIYSTIYYLQPLDNLSYPVFPLLFYSVIDGYLFISRYTISSLLFQQAHIKPVYPKLSFYSIIGGYLSISSYTTFRLLYLQADIKPVNPPVLFYYMIDGCLSISSYTTYRLFL